MARINIDKAYASYKKYTKKYMEQGYHVDVLDRDEFALAYNMEKKYAQLEGDPKRSVIRIVAQESKVGTAKGFKELHTRRIQEARDIVSQLGHQIENEPDEVRRAALIEDQKMAKKEVSRISKMTEKAFREQFRDMDSRGLWDVLYERNNEDYDITRAQYDGIMG